jgi:DNA primase
MISGVELKKILYNEPNLIKKLLENFGCEYVHIFNDKITSTRPTGDNKGSVEIRLTETLNCKIYTKPEYETIYEIQDILTLTQYFLDCTLGEATNYICQTCDIENSGTYIKQEENSTVAFLKKYKRAVKNEITKEDVILDEKTLDLFVQAPCKIFTDDGIDILTQEKWGICYDLMSNRVVLPIRNEKGGLITNKGRTLEKNYKLLGIPKYHVYYKVETGHILFGEWENKDEIKISDSIILVESEKSVMKLWQIGHKNCVAIGRKSISRQQRNKLLAYGKKIIIAFDFDVKEDELKIISKIFKGLVPVEYILDDGSLLKKKESPCDKGQKIFEQLLKNRIKFRE